MPEVELWHWLGFAAFVAVMLILDLAVFHRAVRETTLREAGLWTLAWFLLAIGFNGLIWWWAGAHAAVVFLTGYLTEWSLSMDNVFVFAVIFGYFGVPMKYQHRVLFWGIMGAVVMRLSFFFVGAEVLERFHWTIWIFGGFLIFSGLKLMWKDEAETNPEKNLVLRLARRFLRVAPGNHEERFLVKTGGKLHVTPLFLVLLVIESSDVLFAVDSVPAIFGIIGPLGLGFFDIGFFIGFTSNIFAILGLRMLYFLLAGVMGSFRYLHYGLAAILVFIGVKMLVEQWWHPPVWLPLLVVIFLFAISVIASLVASWLEKRRPVPTAPETSQIPESRRT